jgi:endonuclease/exonuclease/phosphatase family metal-dependent hydrolase
MDGHLSPARIARVVASCRPDIVALQELDVGRARTSHIDQAREIAALLDMQFYFHPALKVFEELYGDAVMTALPSELVKADGLPAVRGSEPRGAIWVRIDLDGHPLDLINTHLGLTSRERHVQIQALLGQDWLGHPARSPHLILTGDFNCLPRSRSYRRLTTLLKDSQVQRPFRSASTFPSGMPILRIDYVFISKQIDVESIAPVLTSEARLASDHLPLQMDFSLLKQAPQAGLP